jgi:ParB family transcriptional regulator, chromosome partitioning protein
MARRRLTLGSLSGDTLDVPRAEHGLTLSPALSLSPTAPIARVAAEAAGAAALQELTETVARARDSGRMVLDLPLSAIAPDHLARDRIPAEDEEMGSLRESLRLHGQRTPIEVTPLVSEGRAGALPYGLISGWRRLQALKALHAETADPRFSTIQALVRRPETAADAYVTMVEENEIRLGLSHYERARVAALATARGVFPSEDDALRALFATASRPKRSRIRAFLDIFHALDGTLRFPAHLPERLGLALVERLRAGDGPRIAAALAETAPDTPESELALLVALLATPKPAPTVEHVRPGLALETRLKGRTLTLKLTGEAVTPTLAADLRALLDRLPGRG